MRSNVLQMFLVLLVFFVTHKRPDLIELLAFTMTGFFVFSVISYDPYDPIAILITIFYVLIVLTIVMHTANLDFLIYVLLGVFLSIFFDLFDKQH